VGPGGDKKVVMQVGNYKMTVEDLRYEMAHMPYDDEGLLKSEEGRNRYLDRLAEKEILLQEAQRQGIDREKDFMKSIENHWEQALLKILLERKTKEISGLIRVYDNEIDEYYKRSGETSPLSKVRPEIREAIRQKKEMDAMNDWILDLKKKTYIKINGDVSNNEFSDKGVTHEE
jgi:peptidyl-prolyl cis-trans isomerase C